MSKKYQEFKKYPKVKVPILKTDIEVQANLLYIIDQALDYTIVQTADY